MTKAPGSMTSSYTPTTKENTDQTDPAMCNLDIRKYKTIIAVSMVTIFVSMVTSCCIVGLIYICHNETKNQDVNDSKDRSSADSVL